MMESKSDPYQVVNDLIAPIYKRNRFNMKRYRLPAINEGSPESDSTKIPAQKYSTVQGCYQPCLLWIDYMKIFYFDFMILKRVSQ